MNFYDKNLELIKNGATELYSTLMNERSNYESNIIAVEGQDNFIVEIGNVRCFIHSIYNVNREIEEMFKDIDKNIKVLIVFGIGCCYALEYIKKNFLKLERLIVVEPDLNLFKNIMKVVNIQDSLKYFKQVSFIVNRTNDDACQLICSANEDYYDISMNMVYNISYRTLYKDYYEKMHSFIISYIRNSLVNIGTKEFFKYQWSINIFRNIKKTQYFLSSFVNKYKGKAAILVSAGPSLNNNIHLLNKIKGKAIIAPVGTSINILHNHGITPDMRFAFDGSNAENDVFKGIDTEVCPLFYTNKLHWNILTYYNGPKVNMISDQDIIDRYIYDSANIKCATSRGGFSIANIAADVLIKMGFEKIIFIGQDLCYTDGKLFAKGFSNNNENVDVTSSNMFETEDIYGNKVYTDKPFWGMKQYFERLIKENNKVKFINATEGGLNIIGAENATLEDVINNELKESYDFKDIFNSIVKDIDIKAFNDKIYEAMLKIEENILAIENINENRLKLLKKFRKSINKNNSRNRLLNDLEYINNLESKLNKFDFYKIVILDCLQNPYRALEVTFNYDGEDQVKRMEAMDKILMGKTIELSQFLKIFKELLDEYKNDTGFCS